MLSACSFTSHDRLSENTVGIILHEGFDGAGETWNLAGNRYWTAKQDSKLLWVTNSPLGAGVSPVWYVGEIPDDFEIRVRASIDKEGLDGGWGVEFGGQNGKYAYRVLVYASGRFCVDRLFGLYPEFIHCIPSQPEVYSGETDNILGVKVVGHKISISVNEQEVVVFTDDRYEPGALALAVSGAGTRVVFTDVVVLSQE
jgi:hypothetical protein